jgi:hypothetical protein
MHELTHSRILGEYTDQSGKLSPDQQAWAPRERAREQLLKPGIRWRNRSTRHEIRIMRIEGLRVIYRTRKSERWPRGQAEASRAAFLNSFSPVSQAWLKTKEQK